jgi:hypothetical protein
MDFVDVVDLVDGVDLMNLVDFTDGLDVANRSSSERPSSVHQGRMRRLVSLSRCDKVTLTTNQRAL